MTSTHQKNFSIHPIEHKQTLDILDEWGNQKINLSNEICKAIRYYYMDKKRGTTKIDKYLESTVELVKLPRINQELKDEDIEILTTSMSGKDFHRLIRIMETNYRKMIEVAYSPETMYRK